MLMLLCAFSVSVTSVALVVEMALLMLMSPSWAPPALVDMVTLVPELRAAWIVATVMIAPSPVLTKLGLPLMLVSLPPAWIVMLFGSSSQRPALPLLAPRSGGMAPMSRC